MAFCDKCGTEMTADARFCPSCGKATGAEVQQSEGQAAGSDASSSTDASENKFMAVIAYILFFVPLLTGAHKKSEFVKYHTNQGTILFIVAMGYSIINSILRAIIKVPVRASGVWGELMEELAVDTILYYRTPWWLGTILWLVSLCITALCIMGIVNAVKERCKPLPVIGKYTIIK